ncbi:MAG: hypothetical protein JNM56_08130 [Planctomycetia bacterium]|nr:hypothetical protein [Planctomycetia bacterium]
MEPADLELFTTKQLVDELMRRKTFLGVIVHSEEEFKRDVWGPNRVFQVHFNENLTTETAGRLLDTIAESLDPSMS